MIKAQHSIHIDRPVHEVFEFLRDNENRIYWQANLVEQEHEHLDKGSRITEVRNVLGRRVEIRGEVTEYEADRRITFSGHGPHVKKLEYHYTLHDEDGGTRFSTEVDLQLADMFGLTEPIIQRMTDREIDHFNKLLKDILEHPDAHEAAKQLPRHAHHKSKLST
ncbi:MAG TPA: SRPBCC family protein [Candidatus Dormibacteraeota bacterium]|nr:SRPBCC family protein [Candidatus Dormibacteraeota bacterium]